MVFKKLSIPKMKMVLNASQAKITKEIVVKNAFFVFLFYKIIANAQALVLF